MMVTPFISRYGCTLDARVMVKVNGVNGSDGASRIEDDRLAILQRVAVPEPRPEAAMAPEWICRYHTRQDFTGYIG